MAHLSCLVAQLCHYIQRILFCVSEMAQVSPLLGTAGPPLVSHIFSMQHTAKIFRK